MKKVIGMLLVGLVVGASAEVEYGSLKGNTNSVTIAGGETFTVMANNFNSFNGVGLNVYSPPSSTTPILLDFYDYKITDTGYSANPQNVNTSYFGTIAGPCRIELSHIEGYCSYKITRHEVTTSPMNIISLPDDNNGDVDLLIETSTDLQSWTPVYSGSAGTSNNAAFFRTRLIQN